ncbi:hypothetical protein BASA61_010149 [Batrachochytrium salamandrivorans]|nr:hypothetical protein BASA61_010149 [Batrachochytrium salamandrivorans]KAH9250551.1 hypothetical protein BASA81_011658 [Batrachochytrium salamandrivorans]KAH9267196.1 hypothetical protein BASA83_010110 [Batrachochytrium salamandrivorans]
MAAMDKLPLELQLSFIKYLEPNEISRLARTCCRNLTMLTSDLIWETMLVSRFGKEHLPKDRLQCKDVYQGLRKHALRLGPRNLAIAWMEDSQYWKTEVDPTASFGEVAELRQVCWFNVHGIFHGVPRGSYFPVIRFKTGRAIGQLATVKATFKVESIDTSSAPDHASLECSKQFTVHKNVTQWSDFVLPLIHVGDWVNADAYHEVSFAFIGHDGQWKSSLKIDSVYLHNAKKGTEMLVVAADASSDHEIRL